MSAAYSITFSIYIIYYLLLYLYYVFRVCIAPRSLASESVRAVVLAAAQKRLTTHPPPRPPSHDSITTAVSADLGTHASLGGSERALATVTAIIDGMGSVGAALGPVMTGYISELPGGFDNVFAMLYMSATAAGLLLSGLVLREVGDLIARRRARRGAAASEQPASAAAFEFDGLLPSPPGAGGKGGRPGAARRVAAG